MTRKKKATKKRAPKKRKRAPAQGAKGPISPKHQRFVEEYLVDMNAAKAAIRAGYSEKAAEKQGFRLLTYPQVREAVDKAIEARSKRTELTQDVVLGELLRIVTSNVEDYEIDPSNPIFPVKLKTGSPTGAMSAVAGVKKKFLLTGGTALEVKLWDKTRALSLAMRHLGMLDDRLTLDVGGEARKMLEEAAASYDELISRRRK